LGEGLNTRHKSPLSPLPTREAKRAFASHRAVDITLDLHGLTKLDAYRRVQQCITRAHATGMRHVAIITGKGRGHEIGVLRSNLPYWLNEPALRPLISAFAHARAEKGGEGVMHVLLKHPS
jgi:DNA-nicking Smr family endonuclease